MGMVGNPWVGGGFSIEMMTGCSLSHAESALCPVNTGTFVSGVWNIMGYVKGSNFLNAVVLPELDGKEEDLTNDWDVECSLHSHSFYVIN